MVDMFSENPAVEQENKTAPEASGEAQPESPTSEIAGLVDPNREVGIPPEEYRPYAEPIQPGNYMFLKARGVRRKGVDKDGHPYCFVTVSIADGEYKGKVMDGSFNTRPDRYRPKATTADDLMQALGFTPYPRTVKAYLDAFEECTGVFEGKADVEAVCFNHRDDPKEIQNQARVFGLDSFPFNPDGTRQWEVPCPVCGSPMLARNVMRRVVVRIKK